MKMVSKDHKFWLIVLVGLLIACIVLNIEWRKLLG